MSEEQSGLDVLEINKDTNKDRLLRWFAHKKSKDRGHTGRRILDMKLSGKRKRRRPKRRFEDVILIWKSDFLWVGG